MMKRAFLLLATSLIFLKPQAQQSTSTSNTSSSSNDVILLIAPFDKDTIDELNPVFHWSASNISTVQVGDGNPMQVQFKFTLVKINSDQTKISAIQQNQPIYTVFPLQNNMLQYPLTATTLERGNKYAWKIEKFLNGALYNQSEVWEFYIKSKPLKIVYDLEKMNGTSGLAFVEEFLFVEFAINKNPNKVSIRILNEKNQEVKTSEYAIGIMDSDQPMAFTLGINNIKIDCSLLMSGIYKFELYNATTTTQTLGFQKK